ncbi:MSTA protein [Piedraia hortae CBS 480.64]|uniref:MSTA protein n=1 Tax=Piedraia hortae CBS 480.64 TaxID=1314780 RepID=A0A6A7C870_9PEZI|nr:MSTA protein [Piedraia hortae CBS 480.64]
MEVIEAPVGQLRSYVICVFAAFAGTLFGYDSGYINSVLGMTHFLRVYGHENPNDPGQFAISSAQHSLIVSILSAGTFLGSLFSGLLADGIGRRTSLIAGSIVFLIGVIIQLATLNIPGISIGRFVAGLGVGLVSSVNIMYLSEVAPRKIRGAIVSCYQFAITIGLLLANIVTYVTRNRDDSGAFRIPIAVQCLWAVILIIGLIGMPESPRFYVRKGRLDRALTALAQVRGQLHNSEPVMQELIEIQAHYDFEKSRSGRSFLGAPVDRSTIRKFILGCSLQMFQQWTGINYIFYYGTTFFQQIGLGAGNSYTYAFVVSMIMTAVNVGASPVSFYAIERFGRRPLLIYGAIGMMICQLVVASVGTASPKSSAAHYCLIVFVCFNIFFFASTWGPVAWVIVGEIFPLPIRSHGVAFSTASNWLWNFILALISPYMVDNPGNLKYKVFFIWGSLCACCAVFAYFHVPETKGLTLEQVDHMMEETSPRSSAGWGKRQDWTRNTSQEQIMVDMPNKR